ncbi:hypothetical protein [Dactylosporangium sp. NPDC049140]|uniref:hypothetical protein n=1 Tax=Dactylosporangium sp. NPDC049140 TaxID=3155647 RepID=UPI0033D6BF91
MSSAAATAAAASRAAHRAPGVDRYLCAWTWLEPVFARYVYGELLRPGLRAIAPAYGVDLVALARHASAARRHRRLVIALAALDLVLVVAAVVVTVLVGVRAGHLGRALLVALLVPVAGALLLVILVGWHLYATRSRAHRILEAPGDPRESAPAIGDGAERRLAASAEANVVPFGGGIPFVGAGYRLERWKVRIDTTKPGRDSGGRLKTVTPVRAEELQKALSIEVRRAGIPDIQVHNRLFVAGRATYQVAGLQPDREQAPSAAVERSEIRKAIEGSTEYARTYLCVEKDSWQGELVVTMFLRAVLFGTDLFVEFHAYVLLPLHPAIHAADDLPATVTGRLIAVVRAAVPDTVRLVRAAPGTVATMLRWRWLVARRLVRERRRARRVSSFNYGAAGGLRALLAAKQREWLFAYEDEDMHVQAVRTRVLKVITRYVEEHGIDTSDLERQQTRITTKVFKIGDIRGRNVVIGDNTIFQQLSSGGADPADDEPDDDDHDDDEESGKP